MNRYLAGVALMIAPILTSISSAQPVQAETPHAVTPLIQAFTSDHRFRVELSAPDPVPMQKYFTLQLAVYDGRNPGRRITDANLDVSVGMIHGTGHEFMHGMQSTPTVEKHQGSFIVRGMLFQMQGPWTVRVRVHEGSRSASADLPLQCCGG